MPGDDCDHNGMCRMIYDRTVFECVGDQWVEHVYEKCLIGDGEERLTTDADESEILRLFGAERMAKEWTLEYTGRR